MSGPNARKNCTELLCGAEHWYQQQKKRGDPCDKICIFNNDTYDLLKRVTSTKGKFNKL